MPNSGRLLLPITGWMVAGGLTAYGMLGTRPGGFFFETLVGAIGWVVGGLSWSWALSEGHAQWQGWRGLIISASWVLAYLVAACFSWWVGVTEAFFPPLGWFLAFALGGAIGGFLTGLALGMRPLRACALGVVPAAALGAAGYPGMLAPYILTQIGMGLLGDILGPTLAIALGSAAGGAVAGAFLGLVVALPFTAHRVRESFFQKEKRDYPARECPL